MKILPSEQDFYWKPPAFCWLGEGFGGVTDKTESVSLYEGDSVTLHTHTKQQKDDTIDWRFGYQQDRIARILMKTNLPTIYDDVLDGRFRDRLQVNNQAGDLTITNINTEDTGNYTIEIHGEKVTAKTFNINVSGDKLKTEMKEDSFILHNNVTKNPGDEKMVLRIRYNNSPVAEMNDTVLTYNVNNERFRDRLQVDYQTGDLIITNIRSEDFGSYKVDITVGSHTYTIHRSFDVKGSRTRLVTAIICVVLLLLAVAVILHRCRSSTRNEPKDVGRSVKNEETGEESTEMNKPLRT